MGNPIPSEYEIGYPCVAGENVLWPVGKTPFIIQAMFFGMKQCPGEEPSLLNGEPLILLQTLPAFPCFWENRVLINGIKAYAVLQFVGDPEYSMLRLQRNNLVLDFYNKINGSPVVDFSNQYTACAGTNAHSGTGIVQWGYDINWERYLAQESWT